MDGRAALSVAEMQEFKAVRSGEWREALCGQFGRRRRGVEGGWQEKGERSARRNLNTATKNQFGKSGSPCPLLLLFLLLLPFIFLGPLCHFPPPLFFFLLDFLLPSFPSSTFYAPTTQSSDREQFIFLKI